LAHCLGGWEAQEHGASLCSATGLAFVLLPLIAESKYAHEKKQRPGQSPLYKPVLRVTDSAI
jgi:hypothetical protein